jgi:hypothetical protein
MNIARMLVTTAWSGAVGCVLATVLQVLLMFASGETFSLGGLAIIPLFAMLYMVPAVPGCVVIGTACALISDKLGVVGFARALIFAFAGCVTAPAIWAALIKGSLYFSSDPKVTLSIGLSCGLACGLTTDRAKRLDS